MSRLFNLLILFIVLVVGVLFAAPSFIPVEQYKPEISALVEEQTGRKLTIDGDISLSFLPRVAVNVKDVRFENADWADTPDMARMDEMDVVLQIAPLLRGEIALDRFILRKPVIHLAVNRSGKGNWVFDAPASSGAPAAPVAPAPEDAGGDSGFAVNDVQLGLISLDGGEIHYKDARSGAAYHLNDINLDVALTSLDSPLNVDGSLVWNGDKLDLSLNVAAPRALMDGDRTDFALTLDAPKIQTDVTGSLDMDPTLSISGRSSLDVTSIRELAAWAGQPLAPGGGFGALSLSGDVTVDGDIYRFANANLGVDGMSGTGDITVDAGRTRPKISGTLALDKLDANVYMDGGATTGGSASGGGSSGNAAAQGWSEAPIDLTGLQAVDADLSLSVGEILVQDIVVGASALDLDLLAGKLTANLTRLALYEGSGRGTLVLDGSGRTAAVNANFNLDGLSAYPFLKDAAQFERLEGTGAFNINVTTRGGSQKAMMSALNGSGAISFTDGAIRGINIAQLMRNVFAAATSGWESGGSQSTDFSELGGTFTISNGVLTNNDLKMLGPLVRVTGAGTVSMPPQTLNYRVEPKLAATLEGQGGSGDVRGVEVPVVISGPWSNPRFTPDLAAVLQNPDGIRDVIDSVKEDGGRGLLEGLMGGGARQEGASTEQNANPPAEEEDKPNPEQLIRGLFNR